MHWQKSVPVKMFKRVFLSSERQQRLWKPLWMSTKLMMTGLIDSRYNNEKVTKRLHFPFVYFGEAVLILLCVLSGKTLNV